MSNILMTNQYEDHMAMIVPHHSEWLEEIHRQQSMNLQECILSMWDVLMDPLCAVSLYNLGTRLELLLQFQLWK